MSTAQIAAQSGSLVGGEFVTFYAGDLLLGIPIQKVEEINRQLSVTRVPNAPGFVHGVINLRGEVVTVLDLRTILGLEGTEIPSRCRNVVVQHGGERIGLLVDRIADVVRAGHEDLEPSPGNVKGVDGRFFYGVCKLESQLLVILDVEMALTAGSASN